MTGLTNEQKAALGKILPWRATYDFYTDILYWATGDNSLKWFIVDAAWGDLHKMLWEQDEWELFEHLNDYAGDLYLTSIELEGADVVVTIYRDEKEAF